MKSLYPYLLWLILCTVSNGIHAGVPEPLKIAQLETTLLPDPAGGGGGNDLNVHSVVIDGDRAAVGSYNLYATGAVTIYERINGQWQPMSEIRPRGLDPDDDFGGRVELSGDTLLVAAMGDDEEGQNSGAVYVFEYQQNSWHQVQKINNPVAVPHANFGRLIKRISNQLFIAAASDDGPSHLAVYEYDGQAWQEIQTLIPAQLSDFAAFGTDLELIGDQLLVAAYGQNNYTGAVFIYEQVNGLWQESGLLTAPGMPPEIGFGTALLHTPAGLFVGAYLENQPGVQWGGAVYRFTSDGDDWQFADKLLPSALNDQSFFGAKIAYENDLLYVSSPGLENTSGTQNGALHVFDLTLNQLEVEVIRISETPYRRYFAGDFSLADGHLLIMDGQMVNQTEQSRGRVYFLDVNSDHQLIYEHVAPGGSAFSYTGLQLVASGSWMMVSRDFRTLQNTGSRAGVQVYQQTAQGWQRAQDIKQLSDGIDVEWRVKDLDGETAVLLKTVTTVSGTTELLEVYELSGLEWQFKQVLSPFDGQVNINFGDIVDVDGDRMAVSASSRPNPDGRSGAIYFYELIDAQWSATGVLTAGDEVNHGSMGQSLVLSGDQLAVGMNQRIPDDSVFEVHLYQLDLGEWVHRQTILPLSDDHFNLGRQMHLQGDQLYLYEFNFFQQPFGVIRRFQDIGNSWQELGPMWPPVEVNTHNYATGMDVMNGRLVLGQASQQGIPAQVHLFQLEGDEAGHVQSIRSPLGFDWDDFAAQLAFTADGLLISAPYDSEHGRNAGAIHSYAWVNDVIFTDGFEQSLSASR